VSYCQVLDTRTVKKTRSIHYCDWCGGDIPIGSSCFKFVNIYEGNFNSQYFHPECEDALTRNGGEEYAIKCNHRGKTEEEWDDYKQQLGDSEDNYLKKLKTYADLKLEAK